MAQKTRSSKLSRLGNTQYKVTNWPEYNEALRRRGDIRLWISDDVLSCWHPNQSGLRGRPTGYSDQAIECCLMLRQVYHLPLRQTEGFMRSIIRLLDVDITAPDYSTLSKRSVSLELIELADTIEPGSHILIDSTGLKVYGRDEWHQAKHGGNGHRTWRKLHIGINEHHYITACELTDNSVGDSRVIDDLLAQAGHFDTAMMDGNYDGQPTYDKLLTVNPDADIIIPPPKNAVIQSTKPEQRNRHVEMIKQEGRRAWEKAMSYGLRALVELAMLRYKTIIGPKLKARGLEQQKTEAGVSVRVLNRMTRLGMPASVQII